jgi:hypothetical protein
MASSKEKPKQNDLAWEELSSATQEEKEDNTPEAPREEESPKPGVDTELSKVRALKAKLEEEYPEHDIVLLKMRRLKGIKPYLVRSMDLKDSEDLEKETVAECKAYLEQLKDRQMKEKASPDSVFLTQRDQDNIQDRLMVVKCTLYPENIKDLIDEKKIKPGEYAELVRVIIATSGFFPASVDDGDEQIEEGLDRTLDSDLE